MRWGRRCHVPHGRVAGAVEVGPLVRRTCPRVGAGPDNARPIDARRLNDSRGTACRLRGCPGQQARGHGWVPTLEPQPCPVRDPNDRATSTPASPTPTAPRCADSDSRTSTTPRPTSTAASRAGPTPASTVRPSGRSTPPLQSSRPPSARCRPSRPLLPLPSPNPAPRPLPRGPAAYCAARPRAIARSPPRSPATQLTSRCSARSPQRPLFQLSTKTTPPRSTAPVRADTPRGHGALIPPRPGIRPIPSPEPLPPLATELH